MDRKHGQKKTNSLHCPKLYASVGTLLGRTVGVHQVYEGWSTRELSSLVADRLYLYLGMVQVSHDVGADSNWREAWISSDHS